MSRDSFWALVDAAGWDGLRERWAARSTACLAALAIVLNLLIAVAP